MDILRAVDTGDLAVLALLGLSAAFDTVDHATLLRLLDVSYGIRGRVLTWFTSYLGGRCQFVRCGASKSAKKCVLFGVHQGSVLGPILFLLYTDRAARTPRTSLRQSMVLVHLLQHISCCNRSPHAQMM
jgi:Reverse transcriptase (RNA-dependent DNA polymerase)